MQILIAKSDYGQGDNWLPVWLHLEDTAHTIKYLLRERYFNLYQSSGLSEEDFSKTAILLAYLHDIGKMTPLFQAKILRALPLQRSLLEKYIGQIPCYDAFTQKISHYFMGEVILVHMGCPESFASMIGSHHGMPANESMPELSPTSEAYYGKPVQKAFWEEIWRAWIAYALEQSGFTTWQDLPSLPKKAQVLLSGLLITADWLASNTTYFPLFPIESIVIPAECDIAARAQAAWARIAFTDIWQSERYAFSSEEFEMEFSFSPNAVQRAVLDALEQSEDPRLFILEAPMGIGKTEAALAAAEILAQKYGKTGLFFGMPTQATANGIFPRVRHWAELQTSTWAHAFSVNLVHGNAAFVPAFQELLESQIHIDDEDSDSPLCVHDFFKGRKQACLADFVIGTVDQLLMLALKTKHTMLRHLGLSQKVVIIDECHAYDAYMNQYLDCALSWLGTYGVPVILLSATLPAQRRTEMVHAYLRQAAHPLHTCAPWQTSCAYPLLTWTNGEALQSVRQAILTDTSTPHTVRVTRIGDDLVSQHVQKVVEAGGCVGVICNTVVRAQTFAAACGALDGAKIILYHAQYLMPDRIQKETQLLQTIGKESKEERAGTVVIGTQVLEQSLDIDFDLLITDLCPMDLLLQRIGRLHRHVRNRPAGLVIPQCLVLGAEGEQFEPASEHIYGKWLLYRTQLLLPCEITLPQDIAPLVQATYAPYQEGEEQQTAWADFEMKTQQKQENAHGFVLGRPKESRRLQTLHGWLSGASQDAKAEATVRDGISSLEVLVMVQKPDGSLAYLSWQHDGKALSTTVCPPEEDCKHIAQQRMRLPSVLCMPWCINDTIAAIECMDQSLQKWQASHWLRGELFLLLEEATLSAVVGKYRLTYCREAGLTYQKEGSI